MKALLVCLVLSAGLAQAAPKAAATEKTEKVTLRARGAKLATRAVAAVKTGMRKVIRRRTVKAVDTEKPALAEHVAPAEHALAAEHTAPSIEHAAAVAHPAAAPAAQHTASAYDSNPAFAAAAMRKRSQEDRERIAKEAVMQKVQPWVPGNQTLLEPRANMIPFAGNDKNPITGGGVVRVYVKQELKPGASMWQRMKHRFSKYRYRQMDMHISKDGIATPLSTQSQLARHKFARWVGKNIPIHTLVKDAIKSPRFLEGAITMALGGASIAVHPAIAGAAAARVVSVLSDGIKQQRALREQAFTETAAWAKSRVDGSNTPTLSETYEQYKNNLQKLSPGSREMDGYDFAQRLALNGL